MSRVGKGEVMWESTIHDPGLGFGLDWRYRMLLLSSQTQYPRTIGRVVLERLHILFYSLAGAYFLAWSHSEEFSKINLYSQITETNFKNAC